MAGTQLDGRLDRPYPAFPSFSKDSVKGKLPYGMARSRSTVRISAARMPSLLSRFDSFVAGRQALGVPRADMHDRSWNPLPSNLQKSIHANNN